MRASSPDGPHGPSADLGGLQGQAGADVLRLHAMPGRVPHTMADMAQVMQEMGAQAEQVQVLFVYVDPERDTQALLAEYVPAFDKRFVDLYGDAAATARWPRNSRCTPGRGRDGQQLHGGPHGRHLCVRPRRQDPPVRAPAAPPSRTILNFCYPDPVAPRGAIFRICSTWTNVSSLTPAWQPSSFC